MNKDTFEKTQFNKIIEKLSHYTLSEYGKRRVYDLQPSAQLEVVKKRLKETAEAKALLLANVHVPFMGLSDIEYLTTRVEKGFILEPAELIHYADFLRSNRMIQQFMKKHIFSAPLLARYSENFVLFTEIEERIYQVIRNNQVENEASKELRKIRKQLTQCEEEVNQKLRAFLRHAQNTKKIQEQIIVKKNERYTIPIKASFKKQVTGTIVDASTKGTTVFIEPSSVRKLNDKLLLLKMEEATEVYQILAELTGLIAEKIQVIYKNIEIVAEYDMIFAKAKFSREIKGIEPEINRQGIIHLVNVCHPLLGENAVPLSLDIGERYRGLSITGPNAGGKTVVLKTVGLITLQTMIGLQIKAEIGTNVALFDQIFVDIGDHQSIENSLSTFSGHMSNISTIYSQTKANSLILLDEIGSGTEPNEGAALAIAIMEGFYQKGSILLTTTHYGEIKRFSQKHEDFTTAAMMFDPEKLTPKYKLLLGEVGESNAFWIAEKMHLDTQIIKQANYYLDSRDYRIEKKVFKSLEHKKKVKQEGHTWCKGDRVIWTEKNKVGLVYEQLIGSPMVKIYVEKEMIHVHSRQLKLQGKSIDLYPNGYDLESLFEDFHERKKRKDLERGSKKAYKRLRKEQKMDRKERT